MSRPVTDIDGREIPPPEPTSDGAAFERLILFCRRNHIQITGCVKVGSITVQSVTDMDLPGAKPVVEPGPWAAAGWVPT